MRWSSRMLMCAAVSLFMVLMNALPGAAAAYPGPRNEQWWFAAWEVQTKVWPISQGKGVTVAVLDTGVQASIPELAGVVLPGTDATGGGGDGRTDVDEAAVAGHGTSMAALIAAQGGPNRFVGVAPQAKILPVVIHRGPKNAAESQGIRYAVDHGAKVINMSVFAPAPCPDDLQQAVAYALERDVIVVAGAGNTGHLGNESGYPGNCSGVLAVGGVNNQLGVFAKTQRQPYVAVAGPATHVGGILKDGQYHTSEGGTSAASALTSAAVALVRSKYPKMSAREVVQRIIASTRDAGPPGKDEQTGYGVVRPLHALTAKVPTNAPNPVFDSYDKWAAAHGKQGGQAGGAAPEKKKEDKGFAPSPFAIVLMASAGLTVLVLIVIFGIRMVRGPRASAAPGAGWGPNGPQVPQYQGAPPVSGPPSFGQPPAGSAPPSGWQQPPAPPGSGPAPNSAMPPSPYGPPDQGRSEGQPRQ